MYVTFVRLCNFKSFLFYNVIHPKIMWFYAQLKNTTVTLTVRMNGKIHLSEGYIFNMDTWVYILSGTGILLHVRNPDIFYRWRAV